MTNGCDCSAASSPGLDTFDGDARDDADAVTDGVTDRDADADDDTNGVTDRDAGGVDTDGVDPGSFAGPGPLHAPNVRAAVISAAARQACAVMGTPRP